MSQAASRSVVRQIGSLLEGDSVAGLSDRDLIGRFLTRKDAAGEAAFAAIVSRHGPLVLEVCRQILGDVHHADDAFQAVFLVLARKARAIRDPDVLGPWLYGVAVRTARKLRARLARLRRYEEGASMTRADPGVGVSVEEKVIGREQAEALHLEIDRLPNSFRLPIVLCYFEGLTLDEAARRLRWPAGTLRSRLARARDKLRRGLTRRGIVLPAAALAAALTPKPGAASPSPVLCQTTTHAAIRFAAGQYVSASVSTLAQEVLRGMLIHSLGMTALGVLAVAAAITGAGFLGHSRIEKNTRPPATTAVVVVSAPVKKSAVPQPPTPAPKATAPSSERSERDRPKERRLSPWGQSVDQAIRGGVRFLKAQQRADGSWPDVDVDAKTGMTSLATLALLEAGEKADSPAIQRALDHLRSFAPDDLRSTYAISLQTLVYAAAEPERDRERISANVTWLERAQIKRGDRVNWPGSWSYSGFRNRHGDNSNTQFALLGLNAASEAGVPVKPEVWTLARRYWEQCQRRDGSWAYTAVAASPPTASMTCAGISSLVITGSKRFQG